MKRISAFLLSLVLVFFNTFNVYAETVVMPTKGELLRAVMLKVLTHEIDIAKTTGDIFYNLASLDTLEQNYPAFTGYITGTDTFNNITDGIDGALKWNESAKTYYKDIFHDYMYSLLNRDKIPSFSYSNSFTVSADSSIYTSVVIPAGNYVFIGNGFSINRNLSQTAYFATRTLEDYNSRILLSFYDSNKVLVGAASVNVPNDCLTYYYTEVFNQVTVNNYYQNKVQHELPIQNDSYIVPNFDNVKTFEDVENLPVEDIYKTFPTIEETEQYIEDNTIVPTEPTEPTEPTDPIEYPWTGLTPSIALQMKEKYYSTLNCNFLFETFTKLQNAQFVQAPPPKLKFNLHKLEGNNNNFADIETVFFDFKDLEHVNIGGFDVNLLDNIRNLISISFVWMTFGYVYRKFIPDKIID